MPYRWRAWVFLAGLLCGWHSHAEPPGEIGADSCLGCHNSASITTVFQTVHGHSTAPDAPSASEQCEACHGPGAAHGDRRVTSNDHGSIVGFSRNEDAELKNQACLGCHERHLPAEWVGSGHEFNDVSCSSCHKIHSLTDPVRLQASQAEVCVSCHRDVRSDTRKPSTHPVRLSHRAQLPVMTCSDCHAPHGSNSEGQLNRDTAVELCTSCHAEYAGPVLFEHAPVSEDCSLCHEPHGSIHGGMLLRQANQLCQSCHSQRGHPSLLFTEEGLPSSQQSAMVLQRGCVNCHSQVHGSNHPSGFNLLR